MTLTPGDPHEHPHNQTHRLHSCVGNEQPDHGRTWISVRNPIPSQYVGGLIRQGGRRASVAQLALRLRRDVLKRRGLSTR
jgi:hypothetical protein